MNVLTQTTTITPEKRAQRNIAIMVKAIKENKISTFYELAQESKTTPGKFFLITQLDGFLSCINLTESTRDNTTTYSISTEVYDDQENTTSKQHVITV